MDLITNTLNELKLDELVLSPRAHPCHGAGRLRDTFTVLRNFIPLTDNERTIAQANIAYAQSEISLIDGEIENSEHTSVELQNRRDELCRFEELERGLLAPVRVVQVEILQEIFLLAHYGSYNRYDAECATFRLAATQVCSYWRTTAHATASLWTEIFCSGGRSDYWPGYAKLVEIYLQYSTGMPLSLSFESSSMVDPEFLGHECMRALGKNAHRWKDVVFNTLEFSKALFAAIPQDVILESLEYLQIHDLYHTEISIKATPKLSQLALGCYCFGRHDPNVRFTIESAPSLTRLSLKDIYHPLSTITGIDWSLLQRFEACGVTFEPYELNRILERMPNLLDLCLIRGSIGDMSNITLPCLEYLSFEFIGNSILGVLTAPRLKKLYTGHVTNLTENSVFGVLTAPRLKKLYAGHGIDTRKIVGFARRSGFRLEQLAVNTDTLNDSWLIPEFRTVKTLDLNPWTGANLESLWRSIEHLKFESTPSPNDLFPALEDLGISHLEPPPQDSERTVSTLIDMLKSRLAPQETGESDLATRGYLKYAKVSTG